MREELKFIGKMLAVMGGTIGMLIGFSLTIVPILKAVDGKWYESVIGVIVMVLILWLMSLLPKMPTRD